MTAQQIIAQVFAKHGGLADFVDKCQQNHPVLEYCAQYRESDMDFVCRLMEQHGISYHFEHTKGAHKLVMGDGVPAYGNVEGASRPFVPWPARTGARRSTSSPGNRRAGSRPAR